MTEPVFDPLLDVVRGWRRLAVALIIAGGLTAAYLFLTPRWYAAYLTVVPSQRSQDSNLAAKIPMGLDSSTDVQRIEAVLNSNSVADAIIERFHLQDHYGTSHIEHARAALRGACITTVNRRSGVVSLGCEDKDPKLAMDLAAAYGEVGNKVFRRVSASSAREERMFLEDQVVKARSDVEESSRKVREFQEKYKVIDLPEQTKAVISAMAQLKGEMLSKQIELSYLSSFSARGESSVVQLQQQIAIIASKLQQLEQATSTKAGSGAGSGSAAGSGSGAFFPNAMSVPELRFELEQLMREQKIKETVFAAMTQRFEMAKVDEARDTSTFQILDYPTLPTYRSRPRMKRVAATGAAAGFAVGIALILVPAWWRRRNRAA